MRFFDELSYIKYKLGIGKILIAIILINIFVIVLDSFLVHFTIKSISNDAALINSSGKIRGGIQRAVKLTLQDRYSNENILIIDKIFKDFLNSYEKSTSKDIMKDFYIKLKELEYSWSDLKILLSAYDKNKTFDLKEKILDKSEETWVLSMETLDTVYYKVYSNKNYKYESPEFRSITAVTGIISWIAKMELYRNSFKKVPQDRGEVYAKYCFHWHLKILTELLDKNSPILMAMMYMNPLKDMEKVKRIVHISHEIHKIIKGSDFAINMGLKLDYYSFIGTNYGYNPNVEALEKLIEDVVKNTNANISIND